MHKASVITCSDRAYVNVYKDRSGQILRAGLAEIGFEVAEPVIVPDDANRIKQAIDDALRAGARVILTTGGTGVGPRDVSVETVAGFLDYEVPGIMEEVRRVGVASTKRSLISRGVAGVVTTDKGRAFLLTAPGSSGGAKDTFGVIKDLLVHIVDQLDGGDHDDAAQLPDE